MINLALLVVAAIAVSCNLARAETLREACQLAMMPGEAAMEEMQAQGVPECVQAWMDNGWLPTEFPKNMGDAPEFMGKMETFMNEVEEDERMDCMKNIYGSNIDKWEQAIEAMKTASQGRCQEKGEEIKQMAMEMAEKLKKEIW